MMKMNNDYTFIRHGQTYWNKNGIMHGQYDIPLNYTGIKQAKSISKEVKNEHFDLCFCSPLKRAKLTASHILTNHKNTPIHYDDRLKELSKGLLEGKHLNSEKLLKNESTSKSHKSISKTPRRKSITENNSWGLGDISKIWLGGNYKKSNKKSNKKKTHKKTNKK